MMSKPCDVLFVVPSFSKSFQEESIGTLILASIVRRQGLATEIYRSFEGGDTTDHGAYVARSVANILQHEPKIVSFYCRCDDFLTQLLMARQLKEKRPDMWIVFGGPQADAGSLDTIREIPWVDFCCSGEGETTVYPLFHALLSGGDYRHVAGLTYRDENGDIHENPRPEMLKNLDDSPRIDYSLVPKEIIESDGVIPIDVGRGCPFSCTYCSTKLFWKRLYRLKSAERIIEEMREAYESFGITKFAFKHDLFTCDKKRIMAFCDRLMEANMPVTWTCSSRVDTVDEEMIGKMKESGLTSVFVGIETGSPRMQQLVKKKLDVEKAIDTVRLFRQYGINVTASFIYGFPEEEMEDVSLTMSVIFRIMEMDMKSIQCHPCAILYGTELHEKYRDQLVFAPVSSGIVGDFGVRDNMDFIHAHECLFPFFYEYHSELRDRLKHLDSFLYSCFLFSSFSRLLPRFYTPETLVSLYHDFISANKEQIPDDMDYELFYNERFSMLKRLIQSKPGSMEESDCQVLLSLLQYEQDHKMWVKSPDQKTELHQYTVDIRAYLAKGTYEAIAAKPCIVRFQAVDGKHIVSVI